MSTVAEADRPRGVGHPKGLYVLFGAEMWERFSFYGMRSLLTLYLVNHLKFSDKDAGLLYGTYAGSVYLTPLLGGFLADRYLGKRKAILIGGIVMAMGHFAMAFESLLHLALGLLIVGNGFFKPNISTMVGDLYPQNDSRRDNAFTIFYMGINLGAGLAPLACGILAENLGWHYGFAAAGVGMMLGLISFLAFQGLLVGGYPPGREAAEGPGLKLGDWIGVAAISAFCLGLVYGVLEVWDVLRPYWRPTETFERFAPGWSDWLMFAYHAAIVLAGLALLRAFTAKKRPAVTRTESENTLDAELHAGSPGPEEPPPGTPLSWVEKQRIAVIVIATAFAAVFWAGFEQAGTTFTLFADRKTELSFLGVKILPSYFQSINPTYILLLAPLFSMFWTALNRAKIPFPSPAKLGIGLIMVGLGFVVMLSADRQYLGTGMRVSPAWLASVYLLHTIGELFLSPIGLSLVNRLAPARITSLLMAVWFMAPAIGNYLGGTLDALLDTYHINIWVFLIVVPIASGVLMLALTPLLVKMSHGRD